MRLCVLKVYIIVESREVEVRSANEIVKAANISLPRTQETSKYSPTKTISSAPAGTRKVVAAPYSFEATTPQTAISSHMGGSPGGVEIRRELRKVMSM